MKAVLVARPNPDATSKQELLVHLQRVNDDGTLGELSLPIIAVLSIRGPMISLVPSGKEEWLKVTHISGNRIAGSPINDKSGLPPNTVGETERISHVSYLGGETEYVLCLLPGDHANFDRVPMIDFGEPVKYLNDPFRTPLPPNQASDKNPDSCGLG